MLESRSFLSRIPDQTLLLSDPETGTDHVQATRDQNGSYAFVYIPSGKPVTVDLGCLSGSTITAHWYDTRTGEAIAIGEFPQGPPQQFTPPTEGQDWVLVLDDMEQAASLQR